ncbi:hypothetical protein LSH36_47g00011 [Paralvinella palmiformis]|uniref:Protein regulator of cytokinesis 1 n=1 Tax=Paralvinella palmiformis TaxID=53620 RepID=A0AAD9K6V1_9ANNE|nr:hypothetical protein LSH36_47g00011 [Paralvinella palmiformis]
MALHRDNDLHKDITSNLGSTIDRLHSIWDVLGLNKAQRTARIEVVSLHLNNLLDQMVSEEESLCERILRNIKQFSQDVLRLVELLGLPPYEPPKTLSNVQLEKDLKRKKASLEDELRERTVLHCKLCEEEETLCDRMTIAKSEIGKDAVPSWKQLEAMKRRIGELKLELANRCKMIASTKCDIVVIIKLLESSPNTSFERELVCEDDASFVPSADNMEALKRYHEDLQRQQREHLTLVSQLRDKMETLWRRLHLSEFETAEIRNGTTGFGIRVVDDIRAEIFRCDELITEKMQQVIEHIKLELEELWDKCYIDQTERNDFNALMANEIGETSLQKHENEVSRMLSYYNENNELLSLVEKWQKLFEQFLEHDRKASDPNRYSNRGCNLLKEEKVRKRVEKSLPIVQEDVCKKIDAWERSVGKSFRIRGIPFVQFIAQCWNTYKQDKARAKTERLQAKTTLMKAEMKYGSRPVCTPNKKQRDGQPRTKRAWNEKGSTLSLYDSTVSSVNSTATYPDTVGKSSVGIKSRLYSSTPKKISKW